MTLIQTMLPREVHLYEIGSQKVADLVANHVGTFHLVARTLPFRRGALAACYDHQADRSDLGLMRRLQFDHSTAGFVHDTIERL